MEHRNSNIGAQEPFNSRSRKDKVKKKVHSEMSESLVAFSLSTALNPRKLHMQTPKLDLAILSNKLKIKLHKSIIEHKGKARNNFTITK